MEHLFTRTINFQTLNNLMEFCKLANKLETNVDVRQGRYIVDGKSIMGLMSLNLLSPVIVEYEIGSYDFDSLLNSLEVAK